MPPKRDALTLEQDLARQAEQRRRQEVLLSARLQELMNEEDTMAKTSLKDIQCRWLTLLRAQKHKELTGEIDIVRHTFEKTLDRKNAVIQMVQLDLQEAEEQYRLALRTHLQNVDQLIDLQTRRAADLDHQFEQDLVELKREFELERAEMLRKHEHEKADLKLILENMQTEAEQQDRKQQEDTGESHDMAIEKMDEEKKQMQGELMKITEGLRAHITAHYTEFNNTAELSMKDYTDLTRQDEKSAKEIEGQMRKIQKLQEAISTWKSNLSNNIRECEERNRAMRAERESISRHFKELKQQMGMWRKNEETRLAELVTNARDTKKELMRKSEVAERVLRHVELCRQLETERERALGFSSDVTAAEVVDDIKRRVVEYQKENDGQVGDMVLPPSGLGPTGPAPSMTILENDTDISAAASEEWRLMERFWVRHNKVALDVAAIEQEKFHLNNENAKLRSLLKQYLDGICVNHEVMSKANNLLQASRVKGVTTLQDLRGTAQGGTTHGGGIPVIEARKVVVETVKQRAF